jgi:hypothetical protein
VLSPPSPRHRRLRVYVRRGFDFLAGGPEKAAPDGRTIGAAQLGFDPKAEQPNALYLEFPDDFASAALYAVARRPG